MLVRSEKKPHRILDSQNKSGFQPRICGQEEHSLLMAVSANEVVFISGIVAS